MLKYELEIWFSPSQVIANPAMISTNLAVSTAKVDTTRGQVINRTLMCMSAYLDTDMPTHSFISNS